MEKAKKKDYEFRNMECTECQTENRYHCLSNLKNKDRLITLTETKKKGRGTGFVGEYIYIFTGVPKEKRAAGRVTILIKKNLKSRITDWETIDENILKFNLKIYGYGITIIIAHAPSDYENVGEKQEFFEKLDEIITDIGRNREIIILGDFNDRIG